jgi:hypothetical protein
MAIAPLVLAVAPSTPSASADVQAPAVMDIRGGHDDSDAQRVHASGTARAARVQRGANGINFNGGAVMTAPTTAYVIWYGSWANSPAKTGIITDFLSSVGGSKYFNINTTYTDKAGAHVQNSVTLGA